MGKITDEEIKALSEAKNDEEWATVCVAIRDAHGNKYPDDWYTKVCLTGLLARTRKSWGA